MKHISLFVIFTFTLNSCGVIAVSTMSIVDSGAPDFHVIDSVNNLQSYHSVSVEPFTNSTHKQLEPQLLTYMNNETQDRLTKNRVELSDDAKLRITGTVLHFSASFRNKEIIVQMKLYDASTGQSLGVINITGQAAGFYGVETAADAIAEGVIELLANYNFSGNKKSLTTT
jgi:hypothetical protein